MRHILIISVTNYPYLLPSPGHDSGMTVLKLERERPAFDTQIAKCFYVKDRYLRLYEVRKAGYFSFLHHHWTTSATTSIHPSFFPSFQFTPLLHYYSDVSISIFLSFAFSVSVPNHLSLSPHQSYTISIPLVQQQ